MMDFSRFDRRNYPTVLVQEGYGEWVDSYEKSVVDEMDIRLLERVDSVPWTQIKRGVDLACGTGRTAAWLKQQGVGCLDGVDLTGPMLAVARGRDLHAKLVQADVTETGLESNAYDLAVQALADEHLPALAPLYREAARLVHPGGWFVIVGYHPHFLMQGLITHFHRPDGEPVAIKCHVHLLSEHVKAAHGANWNLQQMDERLIDDAWVAKKPKWEKYRDQPVSFLMVWRLGAT